MSETDTQYVQHCLDGDPAAFRYLVRRYQGPLVAYLVRRLGNADAASEVAQEAFVRAYFALQSLKKPESFFAWLLGIAIRAARELRRDEWRQRQIIQRSSPPPLETSPEAESEADVAVTEAVARLPESCREVVLLRYYGGLSCAEVAARQGMPLGTVTKTLSRAYAMLRESLQEKIRPEDSEVES